jgi:hypothetical protein
MDLSALSDVSFDEQDANLFLVDDFRLRADAIQQSILPRLRVVMNTAIALIREVYGLEALDDSIVSVYPNFRKKRDVELKLKYEEAFVGLGGRRKAMWPGFTRQDGKPVQVLPFRFALILNGDGVSMGLENGWLGGVSDESFGAMLQFQIDFEPLLIPLCFAADMRPDVLFSQEAPPISPLRDQYEYRKRQRAYQYGFFGRTRGFPVKKIDLVGVVYDYMRFFPVYDSYVQMAKGLPTRWESLIGRLNECYLRDDDFEDDAEAVSSGLDLKEIDATAASAAESRVRVMPAIRWQVFQRDGWRCVACGRGAHDEVILHVDHIVPRSRGGRDELDNFQTLCNACNLGKSNRDSTNLRGK